MPVTSRWRWVEGRKRGSFEEWEEKCEWGRAGPRLHELLVQGGLSGNQRPGDMLAHYIAAQRMALATIASMSTLETAGARELVARSWIPLLAFVCRRSSRLKGWGQCTKSVAENGIFRTLSDRMPTFSFSASERSSISIYIMLKTL